MTNNFIIASLIGRINLAKKHKKIYIVEKKSNVGAVILKMLMRKHLIKKFLLTKENFVIFLQYRGNFSLLRSIKLISKPGKRIFIDIYQLKSFMHQNPAYFYILSTTSGLLYGEDCLMLNIGGELLIKIVM